MDDLLTEVNHSNELDESNLTIYNNNININNNDNNNVEQINTIIEDLFDMTKDINNNNNTNLINYPNTINLSRQQSNLLNSAINDYEMGMLDFPLFETIFTKQIDPMISTNGLIK